MPRRIPKGIKINDAIIVAVVDTSSDKEIIPYTSLSNPIRA